jgi:alpha-galactosidase
VLAAATVRQQHGKEGESSFQAARRFCRALCAKPLLPAAPVYGGNNWYYTYGKDCSAADIERDADLLAKWTAGIANRPFLVIDDGWSPENGAGPWDRGNERFPDMAALAASMKRRSVRPGIWYRPLYTSMAVPARFRLRPERATRHATLDPTVPEVSALVREDMGRLAGWGYELIKHDYSSFDLLGRWGFAFGAEMTESGWHFHDRSKTTAEVVVDLYRTIRESGGKALIIACNAFGHLTAGLAELQRTGDDTSGREFHRTRRMGVNTLAFRAPQHGAFFALDADCAPVTAAVPWKMSAQWLDLLARSGTPLFVSADPKTLTAESEKAIREALATAAVARPVAEALDWMNSTTPSRWRLDGKLATYDWYGGEGGTPFPK